MEDKTTPRLGCPCNVCAWANQRIVRERAKQADLNANYARYLAGELVSSGDKE